MSYKSTRLLVEAINKEMTVVRKAIMARADASSSDATEAMNDLRKLVGELAERAGRTAVDDLPELPPAEYVAAMKPIVANYHRLLVARDLLPACLCEDTQASACVVILIGDGKTLVRAAHDQSRPEMALAVEAIIANLDGSMKQIVNDGAAVLENLQRGEPVIEKPKVDHPKRIRYLGQTTAEDFDRNMRADFVVVDDYVIKDCDGNFPRLATQEEIDSCILIGDPGSGVGMGDLDEPGA